MESVLAGYRSVQVVRGLQQRLAGQRSLRLLGLDVGMRRIGLSWADHDLILATSLGFVTYTRPGAGRTRHWVSGHRINTMEHAGVYSAISQICQKRHPDFVVIGYPYEMDGSEGPSCDAVRQFTFGLLSWHRGHWRPPAPVFWDERYTSATAYSNRYMMGKTIRQGDGTLDASAATLILQSFLDALHSETETDSNGFDGQSSLCEHLEEKSLRVAKFQQRQRGKRTR